MLVFDKIIIFVGYFKVEFWMFCKDKDDMDVYVFICKLSKIGEVLEYVNVLWESFFEGVNI